jgi:hypothetical protein
MSASTTIHIGAHAEYEHRYSRGNFAVYCKTLDQVITFIVAKIPVKVRDSDPPPIPTSAVREFASETEATTALNRWADAPVEVPLPRKLKEAIELCHNVVRPKLNKIGPGQLSLQFL